VFNQLRHHTNTARLSTLDRNYGALGSRRALGVETSKYKSIDPTVGPLLSTLIRTRAHHRDRSPLELVFVAPRKIERVSEILRASLDREVQARKSVQQTAFN